MLRRQSFKMTLKTHIEKATVSDAEALSEMSKRAFDSDVRYGGKTPGGPDGYDSAFWQQQVIEAFDYYRIMLGQQPIGGLIVRHMGQQAYRLVRMFIDPTHHRCGYGLTAMNEVLAMYSDARRWWLDTPAWNTRTRPFYLKCGFYIKDDRDGLLIFEREA